MHELLISDESRLDIMEADTRYESHRTGLGKDFERCLEAGLNYIQKHPLLSQNAIKIYISTLSKGFLRASTT